ncbi:predicted protein [Botrytis cinerea T4]|uniref:Uncharacterized protein n=1 Tax=Botryotinia fuckeliana (strain T4) TaxID=999810 RepID=G2YVY3_BOTF4|nr:predicted protein [Botrytis cinerea T4]
MAGCIATCHPHTIYTLSVPLQVDRLVKTPALLRRKAIKALVSRVH